MRLGRPNINLSHVRQGRLHLEYHKPGQTYYFLLVSDGDVGISGRVSNIILSSRLWLRYLLNLNTLGFPPISRGIH